jgi:hypothetical protein
VYQDTLFGTFMFRLDPSVDTPQISGVITNFSGTPVPFVNLSLQYKDGTVISTRTDSQGLYALCRIPSGAALLVVGNGNLFGTGNVTESVNVTVRGAQATYNVIIPSNPWITRHPAGTGVSLGGSATFSVSAGGVGITYQWLNTRLASSITQDPPARGYRRHAVTCLAE